MSAFNAFSSILSPSWKSMARLVLPSRLELKRPVRPYRNPSPLPLLDHFGVGLLDESSDPSERLAPPITQLLDSRIYQLRGRLSSFSFLHGGCRFLHGCTRPVPLDGFVHVRRLACHGGIDAASVGSLPFRPWRPLTPRTHLALAAHIRSPGNWLACFTQAASWASSSWSSSWMSR